MGATCELKVIENFAATHNNSEVTQAIREAATEVLGPDRVLEMPFDTWSEDFGYMAARIPGSMFWLGVTSERVPTPICHSSTFDLDEASLPVGALVLAASARRLIQRSRK
jgi:metal-dependent amidase/aminoacylase/carboxypeptidase family protein